MAQAVLCDACGAAVSPHTRAQLMMASEGYAGIGIDLCGDCAGKIVELKVVRRAVRRVRKERRESIIANGGEPGPQLMDPEGEEDLDDDEEMPVEAEA